jgi:hypothetical protein
MCELRQRVKKALLSVVNRHPNIKQSLSASRTNWDLALTNRAMKVLSASRSDGIQQTQWKSISSDFFRISSLQEEERISGNLILLKLDDSKGHGHIHGLS